MYGRIGKNRYCDAPLARRLHRKTMRHLGSGLIRPVSRDNRFNYELRTPLFRNIAYPRRLHHTHQHPPCLGASSSSYVIDAPAGHNVLSIVLSGACISSGLQLQPFRQRTPLQAAQTRPQRPIPDELILENRCRFLPHRFAFPAGAALCNSCDLLRSGQTAFERSTCRDRASPLTLAAHRRRLPLRLSRRLHSRLGLA